MVWTYKGAFLEYFSIEGTFSPFNPSTLDGKFHSLFIPYSLGKNLHHRDQRYQFQTFHCNRPEKHLPQQPNITSSWTELPKINQNIPKSAD